MSERRGEGDSGVSMIELIVGMGIAAIVALLASQMLIAGWQTQGSVVTRTRSLANGQVASELIDRAVRRASAFTVPSASDLKVCFSDGSWARFTVVSGSLRYATTSKPAGSEVAGSVAEATFTKTGQQLDYHLAFARPDLTRDASIDSSVVQRGPSSGSCTA
jgi:prepilin-type N-terminal cleavage/methylation domain-containing protein